MTNHTSKIPDDWWRHQILCCPSHCYVHEHSGAHTHTHTHICTCLHPTHNTLKNEIPLSPMVVRVRKHKINPQSRKIDRKKKKTNFSRVDRRKITKTKFIDQSVPSRRRYVMVCWKRIPLDIGSDSL